METPRGRNQAVKKKKAAFVEETRRGENEGGF